MLTASPSTANPSPICAVTKCANAWNSIDCASNRQPQWSIIINWKNTLIWGRRKKRERRGVPIKYWSCLNKRLISLCNKWVKWKSLFKIRFRELENILKIGLKMSRTNSGSAKYIESKGYKADRWEYFFYSCNNKRLKQVLSISKKVFLSVRTQNNSIKWWQLGKRQLKTSYES